jgi:hypothetical protein
VGDAKEALSQDIPNTALSIAYAGKELPGDQKLKEFAPGSLIKVVADRPVSRRSSALRFQPITIRCTVAGRDRRLEIDILGTDLIDRAKIQISEKLKIERRRVSLWFLDRELGDDAMIDSIGMGQNDQLEMRILPEEKRKATFRRCFNQWLQLQPGANEEISEPEAEAYASVTPVEL